MADGTSAPKQVGRARAWSLGPDHVEQTVCKEMFGGFVVPN